MRQILHKLLLGGLRRGGREPAGTPPAGADREQVPLQEGPVEGQGDWKWNWNWSLQLLFILPSCFWPDQGGQQTGGRPGARPPPRDFPPLRGGLRLTGRLPSSPGSEAVFSGRASALPPGCCSQLGSSSGGCPLSGLSGPGLCDPGLGRVGA